MCVRIFIKIDIFLYMNIFTYTYSLASFRTPFAALGQSPEGCSTFMFPRIMGEEIAGKVLGEGRIR